MKISLKNVSSTIYFFHFAAAQIRDISPQTNLQYDVSFQSLAAQLGHGFFLETGKKHPEPSLSLVNSNILRCV